VTSTDISSPFRLFVRLFNAITHTIIMIIIIIKQVAWGWILLPSQCKANSGTNA
jgi:hypothetical protein